jgi:Na+-transporting methylmalonyl-CoA/oxaloacetate decarboxylase gamma subunit
VLPLAHAIPLNNDTVSPGLLGFGVFMALLVVLVFLFRSMNKQMKKIQAPKEADLRQQEWERAQAARVAAAAERETGDDSASPA